jgi:hypothetical protein
VAEENGMKESLSVVVVIIYHISKGAWGWGEGQCPPPPLEREVLVAFPGFARKFVHFAKIACKTIQYFVKFGGKETDDFFASRYS